MSVSYNRYVPVNLTAGAAALDLAGSVKLAVHSIAAVRFYIQQAGSARVVCDFGDGEVSMVVSTASPGRKYDGPFSKLLAYCLTQDCVAVLEVPVCP